MCFAAISASGANMLIFDEPTNHLDIESVEALIDAMAAYKGGVVLVTHDCRLITSLSDDVYLVSRHNSKSGTNLERVDIKKYVQGILRDLEVRAMQLKAKAEAKVKERTAAAAKKIAAQKQRLAARKK